MRIQIVIAVVAAGITCTGSLPAAIAQKKKPAPSKAAAARPIARKPAPKPAAGKAAVGKKRATHVAHAGQKAPARPVRSAWHPGQTAPTPERYKEIQEALAQKGYLHGEATGVWSPDSADALRRFQQDQNLQASGKLDSLSIIALGLGPKH